MPMSTSSKTSVGTRSTSARAVLSASITRESSPPEATRASGRGSTPGLADSRNSARSTPRSSARQRRPSSVSRPAGSSSRCNRTSKRLPPMASAASSSRMRFSSRGPAASRPRESSPASAAAAAAAAAISRSSPASRADPCSQRVISACTAPASARIASTVGPYFFLRPRDERQPVLDLLRAAPGRPRGARGSPATRAPRPRAPPAPRRAPRPAAAATGSTTAASARRRAAAPARPDAEASPEYASASASPTAPASRSTLRRTSRSDAQPLLLPGQQRRALELLVLEAQDTPAAAPAPPPAARAARARARARRAASRPRDSAPAPRAAAANPSRKSRWVSACRSD